MAYTRLDAVLKDYLATFEHYADIYNKVYFDGQGSSGQNNCVKLMLPLERGSVPSLAEKPQAWQHDLDLIKLFVTDSEPPVVLALTFLETSRALTTPCRCAK